MSKRKLSRRQKQRIEQIQTQRRERATERLKRLNEELDDASLGAEATGIVISHQGTSLLIENSEGETIRCLSRQNLGPVVCGDRVIWQPTGEHEGVVGAVLERDSVLSKPSFNGEIKLIAANIDQIVIVVAVEPVPSLELIDGYLVAVEHLGIPSLIAINKGDLLDADGLKNITATFKQFEQLGYQVCITSTKTEQGLHSLTDTLNGKTSVLVGQSGVGKSSLVNALVPDLNVEVGEISERTKLGRHTTSSTQLYHLPTGGNLIDSPGVRQFRLWDLAKADIDTGFVEIREHLGHCKFSNCKHETEPDCAIQKALTNGEISQRRMCSYRKILAGEV